MRILLAFLSFVAAAVFFGGLVFDYVLGDVPLSAAGLFCVAIGLALMVLPLDGSLGSYSLTRKR